NGPRHPPRSEARRRSRPRSSTAVSRHALPCDRPRSTAVVDYVSIPPHRRFPVDPYRLPRTVVPSRYDLRLEPDLTTLTFTGDETIAVSVNEATDTIALNAVELGITKAVIDNDRGDSLSGVAAMDADAERAILTFPRPIAPGEWRLRIQF